MTLRWAQLRRSCAICVVLLALAACTTSRAPEKVVEEYYRAASAGDCAAAGRLTIDPSLGLYCAQLSGATVKGVRVVQSKGSSATAIVDVERPGAAIQQPWGESVTLDRQSDQWVITAIDVAT